MKIHRTPSDDTPKLAMQQAKASFEINGLKMNRVEGGRFMMGTDDAHSYPNERPSHEVLLSSFYIATTPISVLEYCAFIQETAYVTETELRGSSWVFETNRWVERAGTNWRHNMMGNVFQPHEFKHPVCHLTMKDCLAFCKWLSSKTKLKIGLPTEAQWEFAAKGGNMGQGYRYPGSDEPLDVAWFEKNAGNQTHEVGQKKPNELGLYDMAGNVWERCTDFFNPDYYPTCFQMGFITDPSGPMRGANKVVRGGGALQDAMFCRHSARSNAPMKRSAGDLGCRIVANY